MKRLRHLSYAALAVAFAHLVFGAIVRISGSGMGCGDNWPKCYGYWFPPMSRPDLIIEVSHRYLASLLILTIVLLAVAAFRRRAQPGVGGPGGVLRMVNAAVVVVLATALLGALTVKLGNPTFATVAHWTLAMTLLAVLATAGIRAGALGGATVLDQQGTARAARTAAAAATLAFIAVAMGGLTAKFPDAAVACQGFPLCDARAGAAAGAAHIQLTHRIIAFLLFFHLLGTTVVMRSRREAPVVRRAASVAFGFVALQIVVAASMVLMHLPPVLRSLHEAVGVSIWLATFTFAYLARLASRTPVAPRSDALHASSGVQVPTTSGTTQPPQAHTLAVIIARGAEL